MLKNIVFLLFCGIVSSLSLGCSNCILKNKTLASLDCYSPSDYKVLRNVYDPLDRDDRTRLLSEMLSYWHHRTVGFDLAVLAYINDIADRLDGDFAKQDLIRTCIRNNPDFLCKYVWSGEYDRLFSKLRQSPDGIMLVNFCNYSLSNNLRSTIPLPTKFRDVMFIAYFLNDSNIVLNTKSQNLDIVYEEAIRKLEEISPYFMFDPVKGQFVVDETRMKKREHVLPLEQIPSDNWIFNLFNHSP
jgi:hypothetical protein